MADGIPFAASSIAGSNVWLSFHSKPRCSVLGENESQLRQRVKITSAPTSSGWRPYKELAPCFSSENKSEREHRCRWSSNRTWMNTWMSCVVNLVVVVVPRFITSNKWTRNVGGRRVFKQAWISGTSVAPIHIFLRAALNVKLMSVLAMLKSFELTPFTVTFTAAMASAKR